MKKNPGRNGKKRNLRRIAAAAGAMLSAAAVVTASVLSRPIASQAADTLIGIEKLRTNVKASGEDYVILEVVPDHDAAQIGFFFDGYEPVIGEWTEPVYDDTTGELIQPEEWKSWKDLLIEEETDRGAFIKGLKDKLKAYYEKEGFTDGPVTASEGEYEETDIDTNPNAAQEGYEEISKSSIEKEGWFNQAETGATADRFHLVFEYTVASSNYDGEIDTDLQYTVVDDSEESIRSYLANEIALSLDTKLDEEGGEKTEERYAEAAADLDANQVVNSVINELNSKHLELYRTPVYTKDSGGVYHYAGTFGEIEDKLPTYASQIIASYYQIPDSGDTAPEDGSGDEEADEQDDEQDDEEDGSDDGTERK